MGPYRVFSWSIYYVLSVIVKIKSIEKSLFLLSICSKAPFGSESKCLSYHKKLCARMRQQQSYDSTMNFVEVYSSRDSFAGPFQSVPSGLWQIMQTMTRERKKTYWEVRVDRKSWWLLYFVYTTHNDFQHCHEFQFKLKYSIIVS